MGGEIGVGRRSARAVDAPRWAIVGIAAVAAGCSAGTDSFDRPAPDIDPADLPESSFSWNEEELIVGLGNFDVVFPGGLVRAGTPRDLESGAPLEGFEPGGAMAPELDRFLREQYVAGLLVLHEGRIRLERYGLGHSPGGRWTSQSVAKSIASTLVGVAIQDGHIESLDDPVSRYVEGLEGSAYDDVTVRHLLTMTSGVRWNEDYSDPNSDIARFYGYPVTEGLGATVSYMRTLERDAPPGERWLYKTGETHLLGAVVSGATGGTLSEYLSERIWKPVGMEMDATWSFDRTNDELAGCCFQASLRDFGRFGQFVLDRGRVDGVSLVPPTWFDSATSTLEQGSRGRGYGYQWWTFPDGTFSALGIHGQRIHVDRSRALVVVLSSAWPSSLDADRTAAQNQLIAAIAAAVESEIE